MHPDLHGRLGHLRARQHRADGFKGTPSARRAVRPRPGLMQKARAHLGSCARRPRGAAPKHFAEYPTYERAPILVPWPNRLQRAIVISPGSATQRPDAARIMASASGTPAPAIARLVAADEDTVRDVIHLFNQKGLAALDPQVGGRPS